VTDEEGSQIPPPDQDPDTSTSPAQWAVSGLILALGVAAVFYRFAHAEGIDHSAALFVGLPTILAIGLTLTPKAKSATGMVVKGTTIGLLLSGIVLGEGFVCILMAAPLFYAIGIAIGLVTDRARRRERGNRLNVSVVLVFVVLSLEGVWPLTSPDTSASATSVRVIQATSEQVGQELSSPPRFDKARLPLYLRGGFPFPVSATGSGIGVGSRREVAFSMGGAMTYPVTFEVVESRPGYVRFRCLSDSSPIHNWLAWETAEVSWADAGNGRQAVTWKLSYRRLLAPSWYFGPAETYATGLAADYLNQSGTP